MVREEKYSVKEKDVTVGLLNGMYKMLTERDYDLITENVCKCPQKMADPMVRAFLSYNNMASETTLKILLECFALYKTEFEKVNSSEDLARVIAEAEKISAKFVVTEEKIYANKILSAFIDEIEMAYKVPTSATEGAA